MKTIYVDVLLILNMYVNFFLLRATARLTHTPLKTSRCVVTSAVGSLFSLGIFLPPMHFLLNMAVKLIEAFILTLITFGISDKKRTLKLSLYFYLVNFIFAGIIMLLYLTFKPASMAMGNTYFYIDFSLISLVLFTAIAYFAVTLFRKLLDRNQAGNRKYTVSIKYNGKSVQLNAIADTGNSLIDMFSGRPVIICPMDGTSSITGIIEEPLPENAPELYKTVPVRFIPYSTIGNSGMIAVFTPEEVVIIDAEQGRCTRVDAVIGIGSENTPAIFNPVLLA